MNGIILKQPKYKGFGIDEFLTLWSSDPVGALDICPNDRDSYNGDYLVQMINGGVLDRQNVEQVFLSCLTDEQGKPTKKIKGSLFELVIFVAQAINMQTVLCYVVDNFDHFIEEVDSCHGRDYIRRIILGVSYFANNYSKVWKEAKRYLEENSPFSVCMFRRVFLHSGVSVSRQEGERFLTSACKRIRFLRNRNPQQADRLVSLLRLALFDFFGWISGDDKSFVVAEEKASKWLVAQNARFRFPV